MLSKKMITCAVSIGDAFDEDEGQLSAFFRQQVDAAKHTPPALHEAFAAQFTGQNLLDFMQNPDNIALIATDVQGVAGALYARTCTADEAAAAGWRDPADNLMILWGNVRADLRGHAVTERGHTLSDIFLGVLKSRMADHACARIETLAPTHDTHMAHTLKRNGFVQCSLPFKAGCIAQNRFARFQYYAPPVRVH